MQIETVLNQPSLVYTDFSHHRHLYWAFLPPSWMPHTRLPISATVMCVWSANVHLLLKDAVKIRVAAALESGPRQRTESQISLEVSRPSKCS